MSEPNDPMTAERNARIRQMSAEGMSHRAIAAAAGVAKSTVTRVLSTAMLPVNRGKPKEPEIKATGLQLRGLRMATARPQISPIRLKIRRLPPGQGFDPDDLARAWGDAPETIEDHARRMGCRRAVEVAPDDWRYLIMEPETAKKFTS